MSSSIGAGLLFWALAAFTLAFGLAVVRARSLFKAGISLALCLFGVAGLYLMLGAEFLAGVQVLLYIGAVATLMIFAVMLTQGMADPGVRRFTHAQLPSLVVALTALLTFSSILISGALLAVPYVPGLAGPDGNILGLGLELILHYVLPFDVITVLLLISMVGAIVLARKE